jgi:hypothetical protein
MSTYTKLEHWNYSGLPPVERYNAVIDRANELLRILRDIVNAWEGADWCDEAAKAIRDVDRCEGRYPVPQTAPPRDEPFEVTYRCALPKGHDGPHGAT